MREFINEKEIAILEKLGFKRWTKGNMDRMYINASNLGLTYTCYKTGNIRSAMFNGETISNSEAKRMKKAKTYLNLKDEFVYSDVPALHDAAVSLIADVIAGKYRDTVDNGCPREEDEHYCPSSTAGDYGPSHPWDAPGMKISDFITGIR